MARRAMPLLVLAILTLSACIDIEIVPEPFSPTNAHEVYANGLEQAHLDQSALGKDWLHKAVEVLKEPTKIDLPYTELFHLDDRQAIALGYAFSTERGQKVIVNLDPVEDLDFQLFVDLYRLDDDSLNLWTHIATADTSISALAFEARESATYILRVQPELLRGGNFQIEIDKGPSLAFPVVNGDNRDIGSFFGDPRDGGHRRHHGVDIFARRHTPIISPVEARVRYAGEKGRGGRVVWLRDRHQRQTLYFAHLENIMVKTDQLVQIGDTIGTVGNSGNAHTTPPHLHFGIYSHGPIDPYHFIARISQEPDEIRGNAEWLGKMVRCRKPFTLPGKKGVIADKYQLMKLLGLSGDICRVELLSGTTTSIPYTYLESADAPIRQSVVKELQPILSRPQPDIAPASVLQPNESLSFHGRNENYWFVKSEEGTEGWLMMD